MHSPYVFSLLSVLSICQQSAALYYKGFNIGGSPFGDPCKKQAEWARDFATMQAMPGAFSSARLFASSDCDTLGQAVPAAVASGTTLLAGVWTEDNGHYEAEKAALLKAVQQYGTSWLIAVSVGSEDLYRGDTNATTLAHQINEVRSLLCGIGACGVEVGHVDTWSAWIKPENADAIRACDFVGHDGYVLSSRLWHQPRIYHAFFADLSS